MRHCTQTSYAKTTCHCILQGCFRAATRRTHIGRRYSPNPSLEGSIYRRQICVRRVLWFLMRKNNKPTSLDRASYPNNHRCRHHTAAAAETFSIQSSLPNQHFDASFRRDLSSPISSGHHLHHYLHPSDRYQPQITGYVDHGNEYFDRLHAIVFATARSRLYYIRYSASPYQWNYV